MTDDDKPFKVAAITVLVACALLFAGTFVVRAEPVCGPAPLVSAVMADAKAQFEAAGKQVSVLVLESGEASQFLKESGLNIEVDRIIFFEMPDEIVMALFREEAACLVPIPRSIYDQAMRKVRGVDS